MNLHWAPAAKEAAEAGELEFTDGHPTYSPDVNPVENSFAEADDGMAKIPDANFPTTVRGCVAKFTQIYKNLRPEGHATSESYFLALADSMPARMQAVIDAKGAATRY